MSLGYTYNDDCLPWNLMHDDTDVKLLEIGLTIMYNDL